jgi:hypothetical protein
LGSLFVEWTAKSASTRVLDGVDTFVFGADGIRAQTVRATRWRGSRSVDSPYRVPLVEAAVTEPPVAPHARPRRSCWP